MDTHEGGKNLNISMDPGTWVAAFMIITAYSYIIKDSPFFRFAQSTMVGVTVGVVAAQGVENIKKLALTPLSLKGEWIGLFPILIGLLLYTRLHKKYYFLSRYPLAIMVGSGIGAGIGRDITSRILGTTIGLFSSWPSNPIDIFGAILVIVSFVGVFAFFTYTKEHTGSYGILTTIGRYAFMLHLGIRFGSTLYNRTSYVLIMLQKVFWDWLGLLG